MKCWNSREKRNNQRNDLPVDYPRLSHGSVNSSLQFCLSCYFIKIEYPAEFKICWHVESDFKTDSEFWSARKWDQYVSWHDLRQEYFDKYTEDVSELANITPTLTKLADVDAKMVKVLVRTWTSAYGMCDVTYTNVLYFTTKHIFFHNNTERACDLHDHGFQGYMQKTGNYAPREAVCLWEAVHMVHAAFLQITQFSWKHEILPLIAKLKASLKDTSQKKGKPFLSSTIEMYINVLQQSQLRVPKNFNHSTIKVMCGIHFIYILYTFYIHFIYI